MPTIKIITDRQPWANGQMHLNGAEVEVSEDDADLLIGNGFAELVTEDAPAAKITAARRRRTEDEAAS